MPSSSVAYKRLVRTQALHLFQQLERVQPDQFTANTNAPEADAFTGALTEQMHEPYSSGYNILPVSKFPVATWNKLGILSGI
jgi:hypothetical protein